LNDVRINWWPALGDFKICESIHDYSAPDDVIYWGKLKVARGALTGQTVKFSCFFGKAHAETPQ
jgi:hypothetical protein